MAPGRTYSAAPATRSTRSKAPQAFPLMGSRGDRCPGCTNPSLPLEGFAVLNDRPVACQIRGPTDPQGDRWHGEAVTDEVSPRPGASVSFVSDGPISSNSGRNGGKNAGRNCVSALPQRAMPVHCRPRFPSRNRRFPDRCRSADCASTAFRCRCPLLQQKTFILLRRRLRNNYIRAQRAHLPIAVLRAAMGAI